MSYKNFNIDIDKDGIALVTWDMPERSVNVVDEIAAAEFVTLIEQFKTDAQIKGAVLTSAKQVFCAGLDLQMLKHEGGQLADASTKEEDKIKTTFENVQRMTNFLRALETCGKPIVAALNGLALGGGLEIALACHYRVAVDDPRLKLGLPEVTIGLLPGAGGTQRLPRLIGAERALPLLLQGKAIDPQTALKLGLVNKVVSADKLIDEAKHWLRQEGNPVQAWDEKAFRVPGGKPTQTGEQLFAMGNAMLRAKTKGNYPAPHYIMSCVYEGVSVPIDAGLRIESRYFAKLFLRPESKNMVNSLFINMQALSKGARRPKQVPPSKIEKLAVLGAGMMGSAIAHVSARAGMEIILLDSELQLAEKGKAQIAAQIDKAIERGRANEAQKQILLDNIHPTADYADLKECDLIIEAVFEDKNVKAEVVKQTEAQFAKETQTVFGTNTSTIPITELAQASTRPDKFIGVHFFSPVERMQLVEIIIAKTTSEETLAKTMDYVAAIRKVPIIVNDSRGFYTSRCVSTYITEGQLMLMEGIDPVLIENLGIMAGMPMPPLALNDEVALDLSYKIYQQYKADLGEKFTATAASELIENMVVKHKRLGKKNGKGFYDWPSDPKGAKKLWHGLAELAPVTKRIDDIDIEELKHRLLYIQAIEMVRCVSENVITDLRDADIGAILGWGFAPFTGGPASFIDMIGIERFVTQADELAQKYGERFTPPPLLRELAAKQTPFLQALNKN